MTATFLQAIAVKKNKNNNTLPKVKNTEYEEINWWKKNYPEVRNSYKNKF